MWDELDAGLKTVSIKTFRARLREKFTSNYQIKQLNNYIFSCMYVLVLLFVNQ